MVFSFLNWLKVVVELVEKVVDLVFLFDYDLVNIIGLLKNVDLVYKVGLRYIYIILKVELDCVKLIMDIFFEQEFKLKGYYWNIQIFVFENGKKVIELGDDVLINEVQKKLL